MKDNLKNEILELVKSADIVKPARYLGGEINAIIKPNADFKFIMSFADLYEVAISNLGLSILYEVINSIEYASCERVYAVAYDFEKLLREKNIPLYTLETFSKVKDADVFCLIFLYPHLIPGHFNDRGFGPPSSFTLTSSWTWIGHPVSGRIQLTESPCSDSLSLRLRSLST